jgi:hypothetical protein
MEKLVRRITGQTLQELYEGRIRAPRDIDFWLALPRSQEERFEALRPAMPTAEQLAMGSESKMWSDGLGALMLTVSTVLFRLTWGPHPIVVKYRRRDPPQRPWGSSRRRGCKGRSTSRKPCGLLHAKARGTGTVAVYGRGSAERHTFPSPAGNDAVA